MFLLNSRLGLSSATLSRSTPRRCVTLPGRPFSRSYETILPSSLTRVISRALDSSSYLPVSVYGTGTRILARGFSWQCGVSKFAAVAAPHHVSELLAERICLFSPPTRLDTLFQQCATPTLLRHPISQTNPRWHWNFNQLSIAYAYRPRLRSRLTLSGRTFLRNP